MEKEKQNKKRSPPAATSRINIIEACPLIVIRTAGGDAVERANMRSSRVTS
jgi:hypothetical protein